jgi:N-acetyl-anhydromuramyl-L-alanine amidase AmpD
MGYSWIGAKYFTPGRGGNPVTGIVIHWMNGTLAGTDATFNNGSREASAHYGVEDTTVHGYVDPADTAWALGVWEENQRTISIETSAQPGRDATPATIATVISLVADLCKDHGLTADDIHQHNDYKATQCPGTVPVAAIREAVRTKLATGKKNFMAETDFINKNQAEDICQRTAELVLERIGSVLNGVLVTNKQQAEDIAQRAAALVKGAK